MTGNRWFSVVGRQSAAIAVVAVVMASSSAAAHTRNDYREQRHHVEGRARSQVGAPYRYGGTSPSGFDCSGFTRWVYADHGASLPHSSEAQFDTGKREGYVRIWKRSALEVGDLVFHKTTSARVGHAGIYIGGGKFISSTSSAGVQVRSLYDSYWGPRWVGGVRTPSTIRYDKRR